MIIDLVRKSRSWRGYDEGRMLTRSELEELVECARLAPSSVNMQPLKYYLACDREETARIQSLTYWARALKDVKLPHEGKHPTAFIIIMQDKQVNADTARFQKDVGIVAQTMLLAATEKGLGGCMIGNFSAVEVSRALELPERYAPMLIVALGKPDETIVLTDIPQDGSTNYWRDDDDIHYVPKRKLEDILIN